MLRSFADELIQLRPAGLNKTARLLAPRPERLVERLAVTGALSSGALYGAQKAKAGLSGEYGPEGTALGALGRGAAGGLLAAIALKALGRIANRGRRP